MSYVPTPRFANRERRALGQATPASAFHPVHGSWYYVYTWSSPDGWDAGAWVSGEGMCSYMGDVELGLLPKGVTPGWHVVFDQANALVLSDNHENTQQAMCFTNAVSGDALGYDFTMTLPVIGKETISLPIEKLISDAVPMLTNAAWPPLQAKLEAELPTVLSKATAALEAEIPKALKQAEDALLDTVWPELEPKLLADMQIGIDEAKKTVWLATGFIALAVVGSAWWITKKDRPKAA
jgi:hypothetical protein